MMQQALHRETHCLAIGGVMRKSRHRGLDVGGQLYGSRRPAIGYRTACAYWDDSADIACQFHVRTFRTGLSCSNRGCCGETASNRLSRPLGRAGDGHHLAGRLTGWTIAWIMDR